MTEDILFVWIPRTAGRSIMRALRGWGGERYGRKRNGKTVDHWHNQGIASFGHYSIPSLVGAEIVSEDYLQTAFKFCVVRNPWDRLISLVAKSVEGYQRRGHKITIEELLWKICEELHRGYPRPLGRWNARYGSTFAPQVRWVLDRDGKPVVSRYGCYRFERLRPCWRQACEDLQRPHVSLSHCNKSERRRPYWEYYSENQRRIVGDYYHEDIERWGYRFV